MFATPTVDYEDEITTRQLIRIIWARRWFVMSITVIAALGACVAALVVDKRYTATVTVSAVSTSAANSQLGGSAASQFGGLAALAGVSMQVDSKKAESLAVLQSEALTEAYIRENDLLPILYQERWDPVAKKWNVSNPKKIPTLWKANQYFKSKVRTVTTDGKSGLVTITVVWTDPVLAARWANGLVRMTNDYLRDQAIQESERNIAYLTDQASKTDVLGVKQAIYAILQNEIDKVMLARGNTEYALKIVDSAFAPEVPTWPKLSLWLPLGFGAGLLVALSAVLAQNSWRRR